jgi:hypothetical protein
MTALVGSLCKRSCQMNRCKNKATQQLLVTIHGGDAWVSFCKECKKKYLRVYDEFHKKENWI